MRSSRPSAAPHEASAHAASDGAVVPVKAGFVAPLLEQLVDEALRLVAPARGGERVRVQGDRRMEHLRILDLARTPELRVGVLQRPVDVAPGPADAAANLLGDAFEVVSVGGPAREEGLQALLCAAPVAGEVAVGDQLGAIPFDRAGVAGRLGHAHRPLVDPPRGPRVALLEQHRREVDQALPAQERQVGGLGQLDAALDLGHAPWIPDQRARGADREDQPGAEVAATEPLARPPAPRRRSRSPARTRRPASRSGRPC